MNENAHQDDVIREETTDFLHVVDEMIGVTVGNVQTNGMYIGNDLHQFLQLLQVIARHACTERHILHDERNGKKELDLTH